MAEVQVTEETKTSSFKLVCQLCEKIFEESIPIACVHLTFCRKCFEKNGLLDDLGDGMVCTRCLEISVSRNQLWDSQQDVLNSMHLRAKCRRGLLDILENTGNSEVDAICQEIDKTLNITNTGSTSLSTSSLPGSFEGRTEGGTKPCLGFKCETCSMVEDVCSVTGPSGETVDVDGNFVCRSKRVIYCIVCNRCQKICIGKTTQKLQDRMSQYRRDIKHRNTRSSVANHFNLPDHSIADLKVCVIKSFHSNTSQSTMMKEEKEMMIRLGTIEPHGMNKG